MIEVIVESPYSEKVKCSHYWICSKIQSLTYEQQLNQKEHPKVEVRKNPKEVNKRKARKKKKLNTLKKQEKAMMNFLY